MNKIGLQLYTIRDVFYKDPETMRKGLLAVAEMGYDTVEPAGFGEASIDQWADFTKSAGLTVSGMHYNFQAIYENPDETMRIFDKLNCRMIGVGGYSPLETVDQINTFIDQVNEVGAKFARSGFTFYYHNHSHEFMRRENGKRMYDMFLEGFDPAGTALQLDCFWAQNAGLDVASYITEHSDRIRLIHIKDMAVQKREDGMGVENIMTEVGNGNMNYAPIVKAANEAGITNFVVEQDRNWVDGDPMKAAAQSCAYIRKNLMF